MDFSLLKAIILWLSLTSLAYSIGVEKLPENIEWQTGDPVKEGLIASKEAKVGGKVTTFVSSFPLTLRWVGPDSNGAFNNYLYDLTIPLVIEHPNTGAWIPGLASHWAVDANKKTVYYKLNPTVKWSDGEKVTADDYIFMLNFYRSKFITAPWYNQYYGEEIETIQKFVAKDGKEVVAITLPIPKAEVIYLTGNLRPLPEHFYKLDKNFVRDYNWKKPPQTGAYAISKVRKGKSITFKRVKNWWGEKHPWFQNRFNAKKVEFTVIRDFNTAFEYFKKGKLDFFPLTLPEYWHERAKGGDFATGKIRKVVAYNDRPQSDQLIIMNRNYKFFKDKNIRIAFQHAINLDKVIKRVLRGDYERQPSISYGFGDYSNTEIKPRSFDLERANKLLDAAGWQKRGPDGIRVKNGEKLSVPLVYRAKIHEERYVVVREDAKKAGIDIQLKFMDPSTGFKFIRDKKSNFTAMGWAPYNYPQYYSRYHSDNANKRQTNNISNTASPELDKLIEGYRSSTDRKERTATAKKIQQWVHDDAAEMPTFLVPYYRFGHWWHMKFPQTLTTKFNDSVSLFKWDDGGTFWIDKKNKPKFGKEVVVVDETYRRK